MLHASRENLLLPVDLVHAPTGTLIEVDGPEHFTSLTAHGARAVPGRRGRSASTATRTRDLCREWAPRTDRLARGLPAKGFGFGGVARERAYRDALRDLATPAMGHPPLVRIAASTATAPPPSPRTASACWPLLA